ncbi:hypothetical protein Tco_0825787 [Tanacetum coccineum]
MLAITISWFLVCEVSEAFNDMIEHETHFIPNLMDEGLSVSAMETIYGGGRCGRKGGMEDVWRVENVVVRNDDEGGSTCEVVVVVCVASHEGFRIGTKSTISPIEVGWWEKRFILHVTVDWERLASGLLKCSWIGDNSFEEISMMFVLAIFLGGFLVEEDALEAIFEGEQKEGLWLRFE